MNAESTREDSRLRVTAWSGDTPRPVVRWNVRTLLGEALEYVDSAEGAEPEAIPDELVLRELSDLDVLDVDALGAFIHRFGALSTVGEDPFALLPPNETGSADFSELRAMARKLADEAHLNPKFVIHREGLAAHVRALRAMVKQWEVCTIRDGFVTADEFDLRRAWTSEGFTAPTNPLAAWERFERFMNAALSPYQTHVQVWSSGTQYPVTAYSAMAHQLFRFISEEAVFRRCAREACGSLFVHQRGRARHGQHRSSGVIYCSRSCASAQSSKEYRDRKREAKDKE